MWNKRGAFSPPSEIGAIILLALILLVFTFYFFVADAAGGREITLEVQEEYVSSEKLTTLLNTPVADPLNPGEEKLVADLLVEYYVDDPLLFNRDLKSSLNTLLRQLPSPNTGVVTDSWNLRLQKVPGGNAQDYVITGTQQPGSDVAPDVISALPLLNIGHLSQSVVVPFKDPEEGVLIVTLYLACKTCTADDLEGLA